MLNVQQMSKHHVYGNIMLHNCYLSAIHISSWAGHSTTTFTAQTEWKLRHFKTSNQI